MNYLLDTATFLWVATDQQEQISRRALNIISKENGIVLSAVSVWEMIIKYSLGKLKMKQTPQKLIPKLCLSMGLQQLPIRQSHAFSVAPLPLHHKDPFDRMLIAQARQENLTLLSPDKIFKKYPVKILW